MRLRLRRAAREAARIDRALDALAAPLNAAPERLPLIRVEQLSRLVDALRPPRRRDGGVIAGRRLALLANRIELRADVRQVLQDTLLLLLGELRSVHLFTDSGVLSNESLIRGLSSRLWHKLLPPEIDKSRRSRLRLKPTRAPLKPHSSPFAN